MAEFFKISLFCFRRNKCLGHIFNKGRELHEILTHYKSEAPLSNIKKFRFLLQRKYCHAIGCDYRRGLGW
jgi:hypothetical protein